MITIPYLQISSYSDVETWTLTETSLSLRPAGTGDEYFIKFSLKSVRDKCDKKDDEAFLIPENISFILQLKLKKEDIDDLIGLVKEIDIVSSDDADDNWGNFYYYEHQTPRNIRFEIHDLQEGQYRVHIYCQIDSLHPVGEGEPVDAIEIDFWSPLVESSHNQ